MSLENGTYISDLVKTNPTGTDPKSQGDDHLRLIKACVQQSFPNINAPVTAAPADLNSISGKVSKAGDTMTGQLNGITPVAAANLARKDYVDGKFTTSGVVTVALYSENGALSSSNADMVWSRAGDVVTLSVRYEILNAGSATGALFASVIANGAPAPLAGGISAGVGRDPNGQMLQCFFSGNSIAAFRYDNGGVSNFAGNGLMSLTYIAA
jgi:hypothetical protein